eukprot:8624013-Pyramimonas_sp.AAC.1
MNLGLRNPSSKDWPSSRLAAARAMAMAPGRPWTACATLPLIARTRPRMDKFEDATYMYFGIIKSP